MICELIAIACLAAHGDIPTTRSGKLRSAYAADLILSALEKLHKNFFPIAMQEKEINGVLSLVTQTEPALTKSELISIYHKCGHVLHRGNMKEMGPQITTNNDFSAIEDWPQKVENLITNHTIILSEQNSSLLWVHVDASLHVNMRLLSDKIP